MKETLKKLWNEYLLEKCAVKDTDEERELTKKAIEMHEKARMSHTTPFHSFFCPFFP